MALAALITWNYALNDETGFLLQRSTNSGSTWTVNFPQPITSSYVDATVVPDGTYWYRVAATNKYGTGSWSNTGSVFVPPPIPGGPYNLVVVSGSAILTWHSGSGYGDYYTVQRNTGGGFGDFAVSLIETYTDTLVTSSYTGTTYKYQVAAIDISGTSSFSNTASILFQWPPQPPQNLQVNSGSAILLWESGSDGSDNFHVQSSVGGVTYVDLADTPLLTLTDTGVSGSYNGNTYYYRVAALNNAGTSSYSTTASILFGFPPPPPIDVLVTSGSAIITWTFVSASNQTASVYTSVDGTNFAFLDAVDGGLETYTDHTVSSSYTSNTYWYKVVGATQFGYSGYSETASISLQWPPLAPINLTPTSGSSYVSLTWESGSNGSDVTSFERSLDGGNTWTSFGSVVSPPATDNTGISSSYAGNTYYYRCYAYNAAGNSPYSATASITFTQGGGAAPSGSPDISGSISGSTI